SCTASGGWTGDRPPSGTESTGALSQTTTFTLECAGPGGSASDSAVVEVTAVEPSTVFPLRVAPDQRHLLDASDKPFLINGDTPWSLMVALNDSEVTQYLDDRQSRGFNTILTNLIEHYFAADPPRNVYDVAPFTTPEDIRTPNDAYFDRCAGIVQQALDRKMLVMMTPAYLGIVGGDQGWWQALAARTTSEVQSYGAYLGAKFAALPNVVWVMGGDHWAQEVLSRTQALVNGLKSTGRSDWLFTYHAGPNTSSAEAVGGESWLDLNAIYAYEDFGVVGALEGGYAGAPTRPFLLFESRYEQEPDPPISRLALRSQAYWSIVTGGNGALLGNNPIWNFENRAIYPYVGTWQSNLSSPGSQDRRRFANFFGTYLWSALVPDRSHTVLTGGRGSGTDTAYAAKSNDSALVIVYAPSPRDLTIDMTELAGPDVLARWFKPDSATYTTIDTYPNTGSQSFTPPGSGDWVLLLQTAP
ncbi:MAG: glycoside hydrolase family 140 protein, partial [Myxococcales bacterium]